MEENLASLITEIYSGDLVPSEGEKIEKLAVEVEALNNLLVRISFPFKDDKVVFRAMLTQSDEGVLMIIQNRVTEQYILNGQDGFLYKKKNIHGGYLRRLDGIYFHIRLDHYDGKAHEIFFLGKNGVSSKRIEESISVSESV